MTFPQTEDFGYDLVMPAADTQSWPEARGYTLPDRELVTRIWEFARTARLSVLYYGHRSNVLMRYSFWMDMVIAAAASGSGLAGLAAFKAGTGTLVWQSLAASAAVLAIAKPLLALDRKIRHCSQQQEAYLRLQCTWEDLASDIQLAGYLSTEHHQRFTRARGLMHQAELQDEGDPSRKSLETLQARVNREMPATELWVPAPSPA